MINAIKQDLKIERERNSTGPWICSGCTHTEHTALTEQFWKMFKVLERSKTQEFRWEMVHYQFKNLRFTWFSHLDSLNWFSSWCFKAILGITFFLSDFLFRKIWFYSLNCADSGDIKSFVRFPVDSILNFLLNFWNVQLRIRWASFHDKTKS